MPSSSYRIVSGNCIRIADGKLVTARLLEPGQHKVYFEPTIKKSTISSSGRSNSRQIRTEDGEEIDPSQAISSVSRPVAVDQSEVALEVSVYGTTCSSTQCLSFPAIGSVFGDTARTDPRDTRSLSDTTHSRFSQFAERHVRVTREVII